MIYLLKVWAIFFLISLFTLETIAQNKPAAIIFKEITDTTIHIDAITVEAYKVSSGLRTIAGSLSVLVGESISISDGVSLSTSLNTLPGITMQSGTYATNRIVIRGMGSRTPYNTNRIKAYLNGIPITSSDGISNPEDVDISGLGRIEVLKGPSSALYGSGLGGSINLYTLRSNEKEANAIAQYGSFDTRKIHVNGNLQSGSSNNWASLSHVQSSGYRENNHYNRTSMLSTASWEGKRWDVDATLHIYNLDAGIPSSLGKTQFEESPQLAAPNWKNVEGFKALTKGLLGVTLTGRISEDVVNRLTLFGSATDSYERRPFNNLDDQSVSLGVRNKLTYHTYQTDWVMGFELITDTYSWEIEREEILLNKNRERRNQLNIFGLAQHRFSQKLIGSFALAANYINYNLTDLFLDDGDKSGKRSFPFILSPRLGFNYTPNQWLALYTSVGHGFSMPSPEETLLPEGNVNPEIKPEQGWQFEVGSRISSRSRIIELDFTLYWIELNNLLVTKRLTEDIFTGINAGRTRHQGVELQMHNRILNLKTFPGKLTTTVSYYQSINRFINFIDDDLNLSGKKLPGIPLQTTQMVLSWSPIRLLNINIHLQQQGYQFLNDQNTLKSDGHFLGNLRFSSPLRSSETGNLQVYLGINNFTNTHYASMVVPNAVAFGGAEPRYYYPGLPRHFYGGILYRFK